METQTKQYLNYLVKDKKILYLLEVTNIVGAVYKVCSLTKEGVDTSGDDNSLNLTLFAGWTREDLITRVPCDWQGLASEGRLVNLEGISLQETGISWDNISQLDADHISWDQDCRFLFAPFSIPQHLQIFGSLLLAFECKLWNLYGTIEENWMNKLMLCYLGFGCKSSHQSSCGITCVVFLNETDGRVNDKQHHNTSEILPIRWFALL